MGEATAATLFPLLSGEFISNITVENLVLDGNKTNNENLDGNYAGCIFLQDCKEVSIKNVEARNNNGDGISFQITDNVQILNSESYGHAGYGIHPGTGSERPLVKGCRMHDNGQIGLFLCWRVKHGSFEDNIIQDNGNYGISIGHKDTDNVFVNNTTKGERDPKRGRKTFVTGDYEVYPELYFTLHQPDGNYGSVIVTGNVTLPPRDVVTKLPSPI